jgi:putative transposase
MARKLRLEFPGAHYHVINRGNYRGWIFRDERTKMAFTKCLFEACERSSWVLHAYVVMGNHFHLALETPEGNLVRGMQWLEATFANRFNRYRAEHGHLFQGRYKSLVVEPGGALGQVCDYIHLNPVRAGLVTAPELARYPYSSFCYLNRPEARPAFLQMGTALKEAGALADTAQGRTAYQDYLVWQAARGPAGRNEAYVCLSRGWALGSQEFRARLILDHALAGTVRAWEVSGAEEVHRTRWRTAMTLALSALAKTETDICHDRKSALWKVAVASHLKRTTQATNGWLAQTLQMGGGVAVSQYVGGFRRMAESGGRQQLELIEKLKT